MRTILWLSTLLILLPGCKNDPKEELEIPDTSIENKITDTLTPHATDRDLETQKRIEIIRKELNNKPDDRMDLEPLLENRDYYKETDIYVIDFNYPYLNENRKPTHVNFNQYIAQKYLNVKEVEAQILEDKELLCDTLRIHQLREKRIVNYKIYHVNEQLVSVLFYKENYYSGAMHPAYTFDCLNFDLERGIFMNYEDFFVQGTEEELRGIINEEIRTKIQSGDLFYDCWEVTEDDFFRYKNNFVVNDNSVEYYFEDCVVCPAYTGEYSIEIPLYKLLPVLRRYNLNPLKV